MSPANSNSKPDGPYRTSQADVYTVLLAIALVALLLGILVLYLEIDLYEWKHKGGPMISAGPPAPMAIARGQGPGAGDQVYLALIPAPSPLIPNS